LSWLISGCGAAAGGGGGGGAGAYSSDAGRELFISTTLLRVLIAFSRMGST